MDPHSAPSDPATNLFMEDKINWVTATLLLAVLVIWLSAGCQVVARFATRR